MPRFGYQAQDTLGKHLSGGMRRRLDVAARTGRDPPHPALDAHLLAGLERHRRRHRHEAGIAEVVITGVDITGYGQDLPGRPTLGQMVRRLLAEKGMRLYALREDTVAVCIFNRGISACLVFLKVC